MYWLPRTKVLVPTDFSAASVDAVHVALAMVEAGRDVHLIHVVKPLSRDTELQALSFPDGVRRDVSDTGRCTHARERLGDFVADHDLDGVTLTARTGEAAVEITRYAEIHQIDLIIMATHNSLNERRIPSASVVKRVLCNADCPVLVLLPANRLADPQTVRRNQEANGVLSGRGSCRSSSESTD